MSGLSKEELIPALEGIELPEEGPLKVAVIPVKTDIGNPVLYILRRSIKDAMTAGADVVVLDINIEIDIDRTLGVIHQVNRTLSNAGETFIDFLREDSNYQH